MFEVNANCSRISFLFSLLCLLSNVKFSPSMFTCFYDWTFLRNFLVCIVSWEPEGHYHYSMIFRWEPEVCYSHRLCTVIVPFWFLTEHHWMITPFWLSKTTLSSMYRRHTSNISFNLNVHSIVINCQLRAKWALSIFNNVPLRTIRALSP